jgi:hypothetical protein
LWKQENSRRAEQRRKAHERKDKRETRERIRQEQLNAAEVRRRYRGYPGCFARSHSDRTSERSLRVAAAALFPLNRLAKHPGAPSVEIYSLKNRLLELLWDRGYCYSADMAQAPGRDQFESGDGCIGGENGCGDHPGRIARIPGSRYWSLRFRVGGHDYSWHQPVDVARWASRRGEAQVHEVFAEAKPVDLGPGEVKARLALLHWVLGDI